MKWFNKEPEKVNPLEAEVREYKELTCRLLNVMGHDYKLFNWNPKENFRYHVNVLENEAKSKAEYERVKGMVRQALAEVKP